MELVLVAHMVVAVEASNCIVNLFFDDRFVEKGSVVSAAEGITKVRLKVGVVDAALKHGLNLHGCEGATVVGRVLRVSLTIALE